MWEDDETTTYSSYCMWRSNKLINYPSQPFFPWMDLQGFQICAVNIRAGSAGGGSVEDICVDAVVECSRDDAAVHEMMVQVQ